MRSPDVLKKNGVSSRIAVLAHRRVARQRERLPAHEDVLLVAPLRHDLDRLTVGREQPDGARPRLGSLDSLGYDRVEHLLRGDGLRQPCGDRLEPVVPGDGRLRLLLNLATALEELRDEDRDDEEEPDAGNLVAVRGDEVVPRRREEVVEPKRREHRRDKACCEAAEVRGQRYRQQVEKARELVARPVRERVQGRDDGRGEECRSPAEGGRRPQQR